MSVELAYLAGFFDGEGSLGHWKSNASRIFTLSLVNSNLEIVREFQSRFGGSINERRKDWPSRTLQKKDLWQWKVYGDAAWDAYYALRPYLREKIWKGEPN